MLTCTLNIGFSRALFLAHVLIVCMEKVRTPEDYEPTKADGSLESFRVSFQNPAEGISKLINDPIVPSLFQTVKEKAKILVERDVY